MLSSVASCCRHFRLWAFAAVALLSIGPAAASEATVSSVPFIDITKFDNDLYAVLTRTSSPVHVAFYQNVSPNDVPQRLQKWISSVEKAGGRVDIEPPPNEPVPKSPALLIGLIGSLWSTIKSLAEMKEETRYQAASQRDVVISLDRDARGQVVVTRITFTPRRP